MQLSQEQQKQLLDLSRKTLEYFFETKEVYEPEQIDEALELERACFVTLKKNGKLCGCIGTIVPRGPLYKAVIENTLGAACEDPRFCPMVKEDLDSTRIEISVLTIPERLSYRDYEDLIKILEREKPGVILKFGHAQATFLPQVWKELPEAEEFLTHLSVKAGQGALAWKTENPEIFTYKAQVFGE
jgi:AmmeMemoRadiSam system protein A